jgi:hypothetical protein
MNFFRLECPREPWGDYGVVLRHGMSTQLPRLDGKIQLHRAGPAIDAITFPGIADVVLTSVARDWLAASGLTGFTFQPVLKTHIVNLQWDPSEPEPVDPPEEPEDYLLDVDHDPEIAEMLGDLWELVVKPTAYEERSGILRETWNGDDFFRAHGSAALYVDQAARDWLVTAFPGFVTFYDIKTR